MEPYQVTFALLELDKAYEWNADVMTCRMCGWTQRVSSRERAFQHHRDCEGKNADPHSWQALARLIAEAPTSDHLR